MALSGGHERALRFLAVLLALAAWFGGLEKAADPVLRIIATLALGLAAVGSLAANPPVWATGMALLFLAQLAGQSLFQAAVAGDSFVMSWCLLVGGRPRDGVFDGRLRLEQALFLVFIGVISSR